MAYAADDSETHKLLERHMEVLEKRASVHEVTAQCRIMYVHLYEMHRDLMTEQIMQSLLSIRITHKGV